MSENVDYTDPTMYVDYTDHDGSSSDSLYDPDYTYSNDKYFCIRGFFVAHMVFNYFVFLSGIACFITRLLPPQFKKWHSWFGRIYILSMLWSTTFSTGITNTGLPLSTIISFGAVMGGLTIGWVCIIFHKQITERAAMNLVQERLLSRSNKSEQPNLEQMLAEAKMEVANSKSFKQRVLSLKFVHGTLFFTSWMQIAGRMFASKQSGFTCHTYPVYKPIWTEQEGNYTGEPLTVVPSRDPDYDKLPWSNGPVGWSLQIILGAMFGAAFVGAIWAYFAARKASKAEENCRRSTKMATDHGKNEAFVNEADISEHTGSPAVECAPESQESSTSRVVAIDDAVATSIDEP